MPVTLDPQDVASLLLVPSSKARSPSSVLVPSPLVASVFLVAMPGAPSSVLVPSSDARSP